MEVKYNINENAKKFLEENLPKALEAETSYEALKMLYELIDDKGFEAPKYEKLNEFGEKADEIYDEIYELNM